MNKNKNDKSTISDSFIFVIGQIRLYFHLLYRQTEGINKATVVGKSIPDYKRLPCYSQICRIVTKLDIDINSKIENDDNVVITIAADSTRIKITNRGLDGYKINAM